MPADTEAPDTTGDFAPPPSPSARANKPARTARKLNVTSTGAPEPFPPFLLPITVRTGYLLNRIACDPQNAREPLLLVQCNHCQGILGTHDPKDPAAAAFAGAQAVDGHNILWGTKADAWGARWCHCHQGITL